MDINMGVMEMPTCPFWKCVTWTSRVRAHENNKSAILQKRVAPPDCSWGACNPVNFTILNFIDSRWKWERGHIKGIHIDSLWNDPKAKLVFKRVWSHARPHPTGFFISLMRRWKNALLPFPSLPEICPCP
jgi:hypothetical protein